MDIETHKRLLIGRAVASLDLDSPDLGYAARFKSLLEDNVDRLFEDIYITEAERRDMNEWVKVICNYIDAQAMKLREGDGSG